MKILDKKPTGLMFVKRFGLVQCRDSEILAKQKLEEMAILEAEGLDATHLFIEYSLEQFESYCIAHGWCNAYRQNPKFPYR